LRTDTVIIAAFALPICSVHFIFKFICKDVRKALFPMGMFKNGKELGDVTPIFTERSLAGCLLMTLLGAGFAGGCGSTPESGDTAYEGQEAPPKPEQSGVGVALKRSSDTGADNNIVPEDTVPPPREDSGQTEDAGDNSGATAKMPESMTVHYEEGSTQGGPIVYVMWLENEARTFVQHLYVCRRLLDNSLTGVALPHWQLNKRKKSSVDGVSGATRHPQIVVTRAIPKEAGTRFTVYAELDHSWDSNDWFGDQPAVVYAVDVDLNKPRMAYTLAPIGWSAEKESTVRSLPGAQGFDTGNICEDMRYITHSKNGDTFGAPNPDRAATNMVKKLTVSFK
jgi:hypothetical protein